MKNGNELRDYAISKIGTPYFYGAKMNILTEAMMNSLHNSYPGTVTMTYITKARNNKQVGRINTDCSGLIGGYRGKQIGSAQLYSSAKKRMDIKNIKDFAVGTVLWKSGHVGVYIGIENGVPMCVEAKGINYGVIKSKVSATKWTYGLTFSDIEYTYDVKLDGTKKAINPYIQPTSLLKKGAKGEAVKWLQFELVESGYKIAIDGSFGAKTLDAVRYFQQSAKLKVDGIVGPATIKALQNA